MPAITSAERPNAKVRASAPEMPGQVHAAFQSFPAASAACLSEVRELVFDLADGPVVESLKWGQPSYACKGGSPFRLGLDGGAPAVFFHCRTSLVAGFRADFPGAFRYAGNRALHLAEDFDRDALAICLRRAMTYHSRG